MREREVLIFLHRAGEVLMLHRSVAQGAYWHSVAGGVEAGETEREGAVRELREETGLDAEAELRALDHSYVYDGVTVTCFATPVAPGWEPVLDWEHDDYRWCSFAEGERLMHWDDAREALRLLAATLGVAA